MIGVQPHIVQADSGDHIAAAAPFPEPRLLTHDIHRPHDAVIGEQGGEFQGNIVGIRVDQVFDIEAEIDVHEHMPFASLTAMV